MRTPSEVGATVHAMGPGWAVFRARGSDGRWYIKTVPDPKGPATYKKVKVYEAAAFAASQVRAKKGKLLLGVEKGADFDAHVRMSRGG